MTIRRSMHVYARCPECGVSRATTVDDRGRDMFPSHLFRGLHLRCPGSGWLVEDEDRVTGRWPR